MGDEPGARLELSREQILAFRRRTQGLDIRLPAGSESLRQAAWAGCQDSVPRSALHSLHARVEGVAPDAWEDPTLVQVWGLRYAAYVVPGGEHAYFTVSRLPERGPLRERADDIAARLADFVGDRRVDAREAAAGIGIHPNAIRYAASTGALLIRWDGARQPTVWFVPRPEIEPFDARLELARRYLRMLGPGTPAGFSQWAGIRMPRVRPVFEALRTSLVPVRIPGGEAFLLEEDVDSARSESEPAPARLLPSGDVFYLVHGPARAVVVPDPEHRAALWPSRVWPGAVLVEGDIVGIWRRSGGVVTVEPWRRLTKAQRLAVEAEAASLPLPDGPATPTVRWAGPAASSDRTASPRRSG